MSGVSTRYLLPVAVLALAAIAVVWPRWLEPDLVDPCREPARLRETSAIPGTTSDGEELKRLSREVIQWSRATVESPSHPQWPLDVRIIRGYQPWAISSRPTTRLPHPLEAESVDSVELSTPSGRLPVHVVYETAQQPERVVAYLFVYGDQPVSHPFPAMLRSVWDQLIHGRRPLSLLLIGGFATRHTLADVEKRELSWMQDAWEHYRDSCVAPPPGEGAGSQSFQSKTVR